MRADIDFIVAPLELKFAGDAAQAGTFAGYAAVFGNVDSHGDVIEPGAFKESLARTKAAGRAVPMHVMHGIFGGDGLPAGIWSSLEEDDKGLRVEGKISGMNTDVGRLHHERLKDGAYGGLSIGYTVPKGGAEDGKGAGEPRRRLKTIDLHEISLVDTPSNALATVDQVKARARLYGGGEHKGVTPAPNVSGAVAATAAAIALHRACLAGGDSPDGDERAQLLTHLQDVHEALTGQRMPDGMKAAPDTGAVTKFLVDMGLPAERAKALAAEAFKSTGSAPSGATQTALSDLSGLLSGFTLPTFG